MHIIKLLRPDCIKNLSKKKCCNFLIWIFIRKQFFWISLLIMPVTTDDFPTEKNMYYFRTLSDFDYYLYIILNNYHTKFWIKNKFIWMLYYWPWNQLLVGLINIIILIYVVATFTNCIRRIQKTYCKNHTCFIKKTSSKEVVITKLYIFIY